MRPEEVPVQFGQPTIQMAFTTWLMGTTKFQGDDVQALGQMFAILAGNRLRAESGGTAVDPGQMMATFCHRLQGQVPPALVTQFSALSPTDFDATYQGVLASARDKGIDLDELAAALVEIAAVTRYMSSRMRDASP